MVGPQAAPSSGARCPAHCRQSPADGCRAPPAPTCAGQWAGGGKASNLSPTEGSKTTLLPHEGHFHLHCLNSYPNLTASPPAGWVSVSNLPRILHAMSSHLLLPLSRVTGYISAGTGSGFVSQNFGSTSFLYLMMIMIFSFSAPAFWVQGTLMSAPARGQLPNTGKLMLSAIWCLPWKCQAWQGIMKHSFTVFTWSLFNLHTSESNKLSPKRESRTYNRHQPPGLF